MGDLSVKNVKYLDEQYRIGNALISDKAFDQLERTINNTGNKSCFFNKKNNLLLATLCNENYKVFLESLLIKTRLCIQPKIDGCTIAIRYINGKFNKAINKNGLNVSSKIKQIIDVPNIIPIKRDFQIRGELYAKRQISGISKNVTTKFLKNKKGSAKGLSFCCFQILNGRLNQYETLNYLKKCGFSTPHSYFTNFTGQVETYKKNWLEGKIFAKYPTNGIVIKINSRKLQILREKSFSINKEWQYAIKN